jgi:transposase InsO family protein
MSGIYGLAKLVFRAIECFVRLGKYSFSFIRALLGSRAGSAARIVALESQLDEFLRKRDTKRVGRFSDSFRFLWVVLSKYWAGWERVCHMMKPRTVVGWHQDAFRLFWRWVSKGKGGRNLTSLELRKLIRQISKENPLWGGAKIRDALVDLGFERLDVATVRKYMARGRRPKDPSGKWLTFIRNHMDVSWAMDFCVVRTAGFKALYVFVIMEHGSRRIRHWNITRCPSLDWTIQQLREATGFGDVPRFMHRDNDGLYGKRVSEFLKDSGIEQVRSAYRSPWQNPFVERYFGSLRRELLDHVIVLNEGHLRKLLCEYVSWYENFRLHQGLDGKCPNPREEAPSENGTIISIPVLGGLHHRYERIAA